MKPINEVAASLGLSDDDWEPYGRYKAKLTRAATQQAGGPPAGEAGSGHGDDADSCR